jgi:hypothetical protein
MADAATDIPTISYDALRKALDSTKKNDADLFRAIVNTPFDFPVETAFMFLGIIVLLQVDASTGEVNRVALSNTELAKNTTNVSYVPFSEIKIPLEHPKNIISCTIRKGEPHDTTDWRYLFEPALTPEQARMNQASGGIAYSAVYPLKSRDGGALIFSYFQYAQNIGDVQRDFMEQYSKLVDTYLDKQ